MGDFAETVGKFVEPATKLVELLHSVYEPRYTRKMADAKAYEIKTVAAAVRENSDIPIRYTTSQGADIDASSIDELRGRAAERILQQETKRQQNLDSIAQRSYALLKGGEKIPDEPVDEDWVLRFLSYAQDISSEQMREIWAKILAGKIKHPQQCSLRTLECLHNLSQEEAQLFQRLSQFFVDGGTNAFLPQEFSLLKRFNMPHSDIMKLDECRLIYSQPLLSFDLSFENKSEAMVFFSNVVLKFDVKDESGSSRPTKLSLGCYPLTETGMDLLRIINWKNNDDFVVAYAKILREKHTDFEITMHRIIKRAGEDVTFKNENML